MAKMLIVYKTPPDKEAFETHYAEVHVPLARQLPGLRKYEISTGPVITVAGTVEAYFTASLYFDNIEAIKTAFSSEIGKACARDRKVLVPNDTDIQIYIFETEEV
jgi:uncharacterized protein (TIGR02118 family)